MHNNNGFNAMIATGNPAIYGKDETWDAQMASYSKCWICKRAIEYSNPPYCSECDGGTGPAPSIFQTGDNVKKFCVKRGWLFGKVISIHFQSADTSVGGPHWRATVNWIRHAPESLPQMFLESYPGEQTA